MLSFSGQEIRLFAIDVFWRKLDFKPAKINYENIDVDAEFEKLKKTINQTPPMLKRATSKNLHRSSQATVSKNRIWCKRKLVVGRY